MKTQEELKEQIVKEMQELEYKLIPPLNFEVLDISEMNYDARIAHYHNSSKIQFDIEFEKAIAEILKDKIY